MTVTAISNLFTSQIFATLVQCPEKVHLWEGLFSNYKKHFATFLHPICTSSAPKLHLNCTFCGHSTKDLSETHFRDPR